MFNTPATRDNFFKKLYDRNQYSYFTNTIEMLLISIDIEYLTPMESGKINYQKANGKPIKCLEDIAALSPNTNGDENKNAH
ncbi:4346_t:CDS:1, partial [Dentiscutata heterogama]